MSTATVGFLLRTSNLIPFHRLPLSSFLVCRSLLNAGAKVVLYNIHSKYFILYFSFIFPPEKLLYNVRTKKPEKIFLANRYNPHLSILTYVYFGWLFVYLFQDRTTHSLIRSIYIEWMKLNHQTNEAYMCSLRLIYIKRIILQERIRNNYNGPINSFSLIPKTYHQN